MSRLSLIIRREYFQTVGKKSFILTTLLVPVLSLLLCVVAPVMLSSVHSDEQKPIAVVDQSPSHLYAPLLQDHDEYHYIDLSVPAGSDSFETDNLYAKAQDYYALLLIPAGVDSTLSVSIYSEQSIPSGLGRDISHALRPALRASRISSYGIPDLEKIITECDVDLQVSTVKWSKEGEESISSSELTEVFGLVLALAIYIFVLSYGGMIMSGVVEEKTNRIVEVIISSCKPIELMLGKIIGVALVGFTQFAIWGVLMLVATPVASIVFGINLSSTPDVASLTPIAGDAAAMTSSLSPELLASISTLFANLPSILLAFLLYFIGGYLLYASLFAAFGSAVDQQQDTAQFMMPIMFFMIFALYAGMFSMENPDGPLAWWCSMIPFTSPITMMVRLPFDVPFWELLLSLSLLYVTAFLVLWLAARIYRTGILMYGKKFEWKELWKWLRY